MDTRRHRVNLLPFKGGNPQSSTAESQDHGGWGQGRELEKYSYLYVRKMEKSVVGFSARPECFHFRSAPREGHGPMTMMVKSRTVPFRGPRDEVGRSGRGHLRTFSHI